MEFQMDGLSQLDQFEALIGGGRAFSNEFGSHVCGVFENQEIKNFSKVKKHALKYGRGCKSVFLKLVVEN